MFGWGFGAVAYMYFRKGYRFAFAVFISMFKRVCQVGT